MNETSNNQYYKLDRCESVCLSVVCVSVRHGCDVTSATCTLGTRVTTYTVTRTLGTSLLAERQRDMAALSASYPPLQEGYEGGKVDTRASEDCTIDEPDFIAIYQGEAEV